MCYCGGMPPKVPRPPIPTIAELNLPRHGVTHVNVWCDRCHHQAKVAVETIDGRQTILEFAGRLRCTECGAKACGAAPSWPSGGRLTGSAHKGH